MSDALLVDGDQEWDGDGVADGTVVDPGTLMSGQRDFNGNNKRDRLTGNVLANTLRGNKGNDSLTGDLGDDVLKGGKSNVRLDGGEGADLIIGGAGHDRLSIHLSPCGRFRHRGERDDPQTHQQRSL